jgi:SAM-dependent methyltransferase
MWLTDRFLEHPSVYSAWQRPFVQRKFAPVEQYLNDHSIRRVLDVGCGPGTNASRFAGAEYVGVDVNERYLARARSSHRGQFIQADLATADLSSFGSFDMVLVNSFLHHLPDDAVNQLLTQLQQLLAPDGRIHILELVVPERRFSLTRLMAMLDRGRFARPLGAWETLCSNHFDTTMLEPYDVAGIWAMVYFQGKKKNHAAFGRHSGL